LSAEGELALMRLALDDDELPHAAHHLAGALAYAPDLPEVHEALAGLVARLGPAAPELFPLDGQVFVGAVAARAHVLAALDQPDEALQLLVSATRHQPDRPWAAVPWVTAPELAARLDPTGALHTFAGLARALPDPVPEPDRVPLLPYLALARQVVRAYPARGTLLGAASAIARRLGATDDAVAWARAGAAATPSSMTEVWLGYAYRAAGRVNDAVAAWQRALRHDPLNFAVYADIAGLLADAGRLDEAIRWTDRALEADPTYDCAVHTAARLRYRHDGDVAHLVALADFIRTQPEESHEHTDLEQACADRVWLGAVAVPSESCVNALNQALEREANLSGGRMTISDMEPPSALALLHRTVPGLTIEVARVSEPDLRTPLRPGAVRLFEFDGTTPRPVPAPPSPAAVERLRGVVSFPYPHPPAAYDRAVSLAGLPLDDLVGLLVHPPEPEGRFVGYPGTWVKCVQAWACLGVLHHRADQPWATSDRRTALVDLAFGVEDWTTETALFALAVAAWVDPAARTDVATLVSERFLAAAEAYRRRPVTILPSLARVALATPELPDAVRDLARRALKEDDDGPTPAPVPAPRSGGLRGWLRRRRA
jgi:tetratricopeptide (TPR) repeat protein